VGLSVTPGGNDLEQLSLRLQGLGYATLDLTDNEMAKLHIRHMVGGHAPGVVGDERVFRVEFPERPGALMNFLSALGNEFNISLFHYRNHGAAYGRILVGFQVPTGRRSALRTALDRVGYRYWDETDNAAYQAYLAGERALTTS
jgi:threonine dehydratase